MYDLAKKLGVDWKPIEDAILHDPMVCNRYVKPVHQSGRGAGGHCFIKDFAALSKFYEKTTKDKKGSDVFKAQEKKNKDLLIKSKKDIDLLKGVYGLPVTKKLRQTGKKLK